MITIYTIAFNEKLMLPYFVAHYRSLFPKCRIVVYNNMSDDGTKELALSLNCEVIDYDTGGKLSDAKYLDIKNNCWKNAPGNQEAAARTDWAMIVDMDEHCIIGESDLINESENGATILKFEGFNMVNMLHNLAIETIQYGVRAPSYDKSYCFNIREIKEINYEPGCHHARPVGNVRYSQSFYRCLHYKYLNIEYMIKRHALFASRLSDDNIKKGFGFHYRYPASRIKKEFMQAQRNAIKIL